MGQQEIYDYLKSGYPRYISSLEIQESSKITSGSINTCLKKLHKSGFVNRKEKLIKIKPEHKLKYWVFFYQCKKQKYLY